MHIAFTSILGHESFKCSIEPYKNLDSDQIDNHIANPNSTDDVQIISLANEIHICHELSVAYKHGSDTWNRKTQ